MAFDYVDNLEASTRSCYVGNELMWCIPSDMLEFDEAPFGTFVSTTSHKIEIIHEDEDEPPFIETLGYEIVEPASVRQVGATFSDWPANNEDPEACMRLTEWANGEGFDVAISGGIHTEVGMFSMTWTRYEMLNKLVVLLMGGIK